MKCTWNKKAAAFLTAGCMALGLLAGCGAAPASGGGAPESGSQGQGGAADTPVSLTCAITMSEDSAYYKDLEYFGKLVSERSGGTVSLDIQAGGVLGSETEYIEGLQAGTIDVMIVSFSPLSATSEQCGLFEIPYLIQDYDHLRRVWKSDIGEDIRADLDKVGIRSLGVLDFGYRETTNNVRPIEKPEDLKGVVLRVMQSDIQIKAWETLGATPVTMAVTEVFSALQTGTIAGQENPINAICSNGFHEVQKYLSLTDHLYAPVLLAISNATWQRLSPAQQEAITSSIAETEDQSTAILQEYTDSGLATIEEAGVQVNEVDKEAFRAAIQPLHEALASTYGDALERIKAM